LSLIISSLAITNLQRKFDKLLFFHLFIRVGNFSDLIIPNKMRGEGIRLGGNIKEI